MCVVLNGPFIEGKATVKISESACKATANVRTDSLICIKEPASDEIPFLLLISNGVSGPMRGREGGWGRDGTKWGGTGCAGGV